MQRLLRSFLLFMLAFKPSTTIWVYSLSGGVVTRVAAVTTGQPSHRFARRLRGLSAALLDPAGKPANARQGLIQLQSFHARSLTHQQQHTTAIRAADPYGHRASLQPAGGVGAPLDPNDLQQVIASTCLHNGQQLSGARVSAFSARTATTNPAAKASAFTATATQGATTTTSPAATARATATAAQGATTTTTTSACGWLTLVPLRALPPGGPEAALLLNGLASLARHGGGTPLLACGTEQALGSCRKLGLACYNATGLGEEGDGQPLSRAKVPELSLRASLRVAVARRVLELLPEGAILHVTSSDTVYTRPVVPSVQRLFTEQLGGQADASMGFEQPDWDDRYYLASTAVAFVRNTEASRLMYDAWLEVGKDDWRSNRRRQLRNSDDAYLKDTELLSDDDVTFGALFGDAYAFCSDGPSCAALGHQGTAAVARHRVAPAGGSAGGLCGRGRGASQDRDAGEGGGPQSLPGAGHALDPCSAAQQLYVRPSGCSPADAVAVLRAMGLWLLHDEPEVGPGAEAVAAQALAVGARGSGSRGGFERVRGPLALPRGRGCHAKWRRAFASLQIEV